MENERFFNTLAGGNTGCNELRTSFYKLLERQVCSNHRIILNAGQICNRMWFIVQGFAMAYIDKEGKKIPYWFWNENEIMVPVNSFFKQLPADGFIELMEKSILLSISYKNIKQLTETFPEFNTQLLNLVEGLQYSAEKRIFTLTSISAEERYAHLMKESSFIIRKASVETIASYIGVSRKTLNRIRAKR